MYDILIKNNDTKQHCILETNCMLDSEVLDDDCSCCIAAGFSPENNKDCMKFAPWSTQKDIGEIKKKWHPDYHLEKFQN